MKQITIYDLLPLLKKGWVAMDENGKWTWFEKEPYIPKDLSIWGCNHPNFRSLIMCFNIAPFDGDWKDSLIKVEDYQKDTNKLTDLILKGDKNER